jgi:hypothetical protein
MKRFVLIPCLLVLSLIFAMPSLAQKTDVNNAVKKAFTKKYPKATGVKWGSESANVFEAEFKLGDTEMTANFDQQGVWLETETGFTAKELPEAVTAGIKQSAPGFSFKEAAKVESPSGVQFEVAVKKGKENFELILSTDGLLIKKIDLKEEKEKEKKD